jgi:hypothetical protein
MTAKKPANTPTTVVADDPEDRKGRLKTIGGSQSDHWNNTLANQAVQALWVKNSSAEERDKQLSATVAALMGIAPKDELESMMAAQLVAAHNAAMECYRRAMIGEQSFARGGARTSPRPTSFPAPTPRWSRPSTAIAARASRKSQSNTSTSMRAGKRWWAWSPHPANRGVGTPAQSRNNPMQSKLPQRLKMHLSPRCHARNRNGTRCRSPAMANGRCRMHGGKTKGAPKGNSHAFKHGRYTAEHIAERRHFAELVREMKGFIDELDGKE